MISYRTVRRIAISRFTSSRKERISSADLGIAFVALASRAVALASPHRVGDGHGGNL